MKSSLIVLALAAMAMAEEKPIPQEEFAPLENAVLKMEVLYYRAKSIEQAYQEEQKKLQAAFKDAQDARAKAEEAVYRKTGLKREEWRIDIEKKVMVSLPKPPKEAPKPEKK